MRLKSKILLVGAGIVAWVVLINYMNSTLPTTPSKSETTSEQEIANGAVSQAKKCAVIQREGDLLDQRNANLVIKARELQMLWIKSEMLKLHSDKKITDQEYSVFTDYVAVGDGTPKLPFGDIENLMKKVVRSGYIKPYLPKDVISLGQEAATNPTSADYLVDFPECFNDLEFSVIESLAGLSQNKGAWANKIEDPVSLIP
jgi:hypothetical protein